VTITLGLAVILVINLKVTGFAYAFILIGGFSAYLFISKQVKAGVKLLQVSLAAYLLGALLFGFNPYVTNTLRTGNPFYPVQIGSELVFMPGQLPANFHALNRVQRLIHSIFSATENAAGRNVSDLKAPFTITRAELDVLQAPDIRVGGFGPLFGGAMIVTGGLLVILVLTEPGKNLLPIWVSGVLLVSVLINPEGWWARYAPQLWLLPLVWTGAALFQKDRFVRAPGWILAFILAVNVSLVLIFYTGGQISNSRALRSSLESMARQEEPVTAYFLFKSERVRFHESGIAVQEIGKPEKLPCPQPFVVAASLSQVCLTP
jgi:hypothetical protein